MEFKCFSHDYHCCVFCLYLKKKRNNHCQSCFAMAINKRRFSQNTWINSRHTLTDCFKTLQTKCQSSRINFAEGLQNTWNGKKMALRRLPVLVMTGNKPVVYSVTSMFIRTLFFTFCVRYAPINGCENIYLHIYPDHWSVARSLGHFIFSHACRCKSIDHVYIQYSCYTAPESLTVIRFLSYQ